MKSHFDCLVHWYSTRSRPMTGNGSPRIALSRAILSRTLQSGTVESEWTENWQGIPWSRIVCHGAMWCKLLVSIIPFIRIPCTILVIAVLRWQGWNRACKDNDALQCELNNICSCIYRIWYRIRYRMFDVRYRTSKYRFLPFWRTMSYTMSYTMPYVFWCDIVCTTYDINKNVRYRTFFTGSCHFYVLHRMLYRTFF